MKKGIIEEIVRVCDKEIAGRMWGAKLSNCSKGNMPRYLITDFRAFGLLTGIVRYYTYREKLDEQIFYRGQSAEWPLKPKLYRNCCSKESVGLADQWKTEALNVIKKARFDFDGTLDEREALSQHYGLATSFIDVVDHIQTALWFAYNDMPDGNDVGYVYVIAVPKNKATIIDLRNKPSQWLRPHIQQAFCFKMNNITQFGRISERYHIMSFVIPKNLLKIWSGYGFLTPECMYPPEEKDRGLSFWRDAALSLEKAGLGLNPDQWIKQHTVDKSGLIANGEVSNDEE